MSHLRPTEYIPRHRHWTSTAKGAKEAKRASQEFDALPDSSDNFYVKCLIKTDRFVSSFFFLSFSSLSRFILVQASFVRASSVYGEYIKNALRDYVSLLKILFVSFARRLHASFGIILEEERRARDRVMHFASNMPGMWDIFSSALRIMGVSETVDGYQIPDRVHDLKTRTKKKQKCMTAIISRHY